jgi:hypothetical protein
MRNLVIEHSQQISDTCRRRLHEQGFRNLSDAELANHKFGIRFAYYLCGSLVLVGLITHSVPLLSVMLGIAVLGMLPPYHPLDYLFNGLVRHLVGRPRLLRRANQSRFACAIATIFLSGIVYGFIVGKDILAYLLGGMLLISAFLVSVFDICIPSKIYNALFERKSAPSDIPAGVDGN